MIKKQANIDFTREKYSEDLQVVPYPKECSMIQEAIISKQGKMPMILAIKQH